MNMAFRVQQHVIRLEISVDNTLRVDVFQCAAKLCHPKTNSFFCEAFSRYVKSKIATIHEVNHNVAIDVSYTPLSRNGIDIHVLHILETVSQVAKKRMVQMLKHSPFSDNVTNAFRPYN